MKESLEDLKTWIEQGTDPRQKLLYSAFYFDRAGITFLFPLLARFPDAAPKVTFSYGRLRCLFDEASPLYPYVRAAKDEHTTSDLAVLKERMNLEYERFTKRVHPE